MIDIEIRRYSEEEIGYWLAFHQLPLTGMKPNPTEPLLNRFRDVKEAWHCTRGDVLQRDPSFNLDVVDQFMRKRQEIDPEALLLKLRKTDVDVYPQCDPRFPFRLRHIQTAPTVLFVRGNAKEMDFNNAVGVVGTRRPSTYGARLAKEISKELAASGAVVVSGLALGIDSLSHWGAIEGGGRTVAVLATGPDLCYPSSNKRLYSKILDGSGIGVSEFFPGTRPEKWHFPARNRIISGISKGVLVVEAPTESGALITAKMAAEQGREVFAIPGRVDSVTSEGTNNLIFKSEAQLVRNAKDVLDQLGWVQTKYKEVTTVVELYGREKEVYELLQLEPTHFDVLMEKTHMDAGELSATLTILELAGLLVRHPGDWYTKMTPGNAKPLHSSLSLDS